MAWLMEIRWMVVSVYERIRHRESVPKLAGTPEAAPRNVTWWPLRTRMRLAKKQRIVAHCLTNVVREMHALLYPCYHVVENQTASLRAISRYTVTT